jgi:hypothetical protein
MPRSGEATLLDPYRNSPRDVEDALEHVREEVVGLDEWPEGTCFAEKREVLPLRKILAYDDYSSWGEWRHGELRGLSRSELHSALSSFRGRGWADTAMGWLSRPAAHNIPAIVIFDSRVSRWTAIGDGRGRVSLAVGLALPRLHVVRIIDCWA